MYCIHNAGNNVMCYKDCKYSAEVRKMCVTGKIEVRDVKKTIIYGKIPSPKIRIEATIKS